MNADRTRAVGRGVGRFTPMTRGTALSDKGARCWASAAIVSRPAAVILDSRMDSVPSGGLASLADR